MQNNAEKGDFKKMPKKEISTFKQVKKYFQEFTKQKDYQLVKQVKNPFTNNEI